MRTEEFAYYKKKCVFYRKQFAFLEIGLVKVSRVNQNVLEQDIRLSQRALYAFYDFYEQYPVFLSEFFFQHEFCFLFFWTKFYSEYLNPALNMRNCSNFIEKRYHISRLICVRFCIIRIRFCIEGRIRIRIFLLNGHIR